MCRVLTDGFLSAASSVDIVLAGYHTSGVEYVRAGGARDNCSILPTHLESAELFAVQTSQYSIRANDALEQALLRAPSKNDRANVASCQGRF